MARRSNVDAPALLLPAPRSLGALVEEHGGTLDPGLEGLLVRGIAPVEAAGPEHLAPVFARRYLTAARSSGALLLVDASLAPNVAPGRRWVHPRAPFALASILETLAPPPPPDERHLAHIEPGAEVDPTASIGPFAVLRAGAVIGPGTRIEPHAVIHGGSRIGARVLVGASAVVGRPGFGWAEAPSGGVVRVPQLGGVIIEDDVELGPLCTVDAGTLGPTRIGRGAKLDAHVHVGHNAQIGAGSLIAAQSGFAGSSRLGPGALVGGQVGVADHVTVGAGARLAAKAGVIGDVPEGATFGGYPAVDKARWLRAMARALGEGGGRGRKE
ncbi:UDP-3-O-(3-hydroxymyristoyl)glucosamine N-acyltransferase [Polyangium aurulentum]|uniref:UDP-3-O-(3-hydroxymyristoyl)glucosamine N-acyltransferase n=1 Tax=Polyangium aurulentum TaxID=2567896 RepID=UPI0010ADEA0C|nr:UDP-3-O-(3-hydroxymyristoyl)glucosamine N-acyltransferase [Polyangium aurulentum]UQA54852.1 UDP-3-O-(3-hydroxymyristoyl)glucosamine N-acyltransferase [Polyangium aurulentum]